MGRQNFNIYLYLYDPFSHFIQLRPVNLLSAVKSIGWFHNYRFSYQLRDGCRLIQEETRR